MTDATVEQQGEPKRCSEHLEVPQAAYGRRSSSSSRSSESTTDTEMGLVDVCTVLSRAEGSHLGGPITLDLTKWDCNKAVFRNKCRKLVENSKPLLLIGSPIALVSTGKPSTSRGTRNKQGRFCTWHSSVCCTKYKCTEVGISFTHIHILQTVGNRQQWWTP